MALKLYDKITPSDDFPLVSATDVETSDGTRLQAYLDGLNQNMGDVAGSVTEQMVDLTGRVDTLEVQFDQMGSVAGQVTEQLTSLTGRVTALETPPVSVDLTAFESAGTIVETYADGSVKTYTMEFDGDGNPTKITDSDGNVTVLTW